MWCQLRILYFVHRGDNSIGIKCETSHDDDDVFKTSVCHDSECGSNNVRAETDGSLVARLTRVLLILDKLIRYTRLHDHGQ